MWSPYRKSIQRNPYRCLHYSHYHHHYHHHYHRHCHHHRHQREGNGSTFFQDGAHYIGGYMEVAKTSFGETGFFQIVFSKLYFSNLKVWPTSQLTDIAESPFIGWLTKHGLFYSMLISIHMFTYWQVFICVCLHFKIYFCRVWRPGQACCFTQTETHWKQNLSKAKSKAMESSGRDPTMKTSIQFVPFFWEQIWEFWVVKDTVQGQIWGNLCFRPAFAL